MALVRALILSVLLLGSISSVEAAMSDAELQTSKNLVQSSATLAAATDAVFAGCLKPTADQKANCYFAMLYLNRAAQNLGRANSFLIGACPEPDCTAFASKTRPELVALAWSILDGARQNLATARTYLGKLPTNTEATNNLARTDAFLNAVDKALTFNEPLLPKRFETDTSIKIFGPHGYYEKAITVWGGAARLGYDHADQLIRVYNVPGLPQAVLPDLKIALRAAMANASVIQHSTARLYGLKFTADDLAITSKTFQILAVLHDALKRGPSEDHGLAYFQRQTTEQAALVYRCSGCPAGTVMPQAAKDLLFESRLNNDRQWAELDFGTWLMLVIVDCVNTKGLPIDGGCSGRGMIAD